ncbi:hypothetical protein BDQ17DRAFT_1281694 [Cyathus striatus]|nr:hypothetical protein BDQ17DRAFT_1281694 [Cyathus striatus]
MSTNAFASRVEERRWNRFGNLMASYHDYFKQEFNTLYELADGYSERGLSLARYLRTAQDLNQHLTMHHTIEEQRVFPFLGTRMPQFSSDHEDAAHLNSHRMIHEGLDNLSALVKKWRADPNSYSAEGMRSCLDEFRGVLFRHLDEEVADLQGANLRKYFTLEEIEQLGV